jgi:hypothetical protein
MKATWNYKDCLLKIWHLIFVQFIINVYQVSTIQQVICQNLWGTERIEKATSWSLKELQGIGSSAGRIAKVTWLINL